MFPHARSLVNHYADKPFTYLGVNLDKDRELARKRAREHQINWRNFYNGYGEGPITRPWNVRSAPVVYVLDADGVIRFKWNGGPTEKALDAAIAELMAELAAEAVRPGKGR
tara:strand:- start:1822 stop:2154 length:333 start_codon:yes stop_codon:yes gene_type:complete